MKDIIVSQPGEDVDAEHCYPLLWCATANPKQGTIEEKEINPSTGAYTGYKNIVGQGDLLPQGPEVGRSRRGFSVFYQYGPRIWMNQTTVAATLREYVRTDRQLSCCSKKPDSEDAYLLCGRVYRGKARLCYGLAGSPGTEKMVKYPRAQNSSRAFWLGDSLSFVYYANVPRQGQRMVRVDAQTGAEEILAGVGSVADANAFWCPEHEQVGMVTVDGVLVRIYLDNALFIARALPAGWWPYRVECIDGSQQSRAYDRSWIVVTAANAARTDTSIWLMDPMAGESQRIDAAAGRKIRGDAEIWLLPDDSRGVEEIFVNYQEGEYQNSVARRIQTGITFPTA